MKCWRIEEKQIEKSWIFIGRRWWDATTPRTRPTPSTTCRRAWARIRRRRRWRRPTRRRRSVSVFFGGRGSVVLPPDQCGNFLFLRRRRSWTNRFRIGGSSAASTVRPSCGFSTPTRPSAARQRRRRSTLAIHRPPVAAAGSRRPRRRSRTTTSTSPSLRSGSKRIRFFVLFQAALESLAYLEKSWLFFQK